MSIAALTIKGSRELERKLMGLERKAAKKVVRQALRKGAKIVHAAARQEVPVRSGKLRKSLKVRRAKKNRRGSYAVMVTTGQNENMFTGETYYGAFVHYGHRVGKRGRGGRKQVAAVPFIQRAYDRTKTHARDVVLRDMAAGIERVARETG